MNQTGKQRSVAGLDLPFSPNEKLQRILRSALGTPHSTCDTAGLPWTASYFDLDRVDLFTQATDPQQQQILQIVNRNLLEEAYFVEKAGMGYMANMVQVAETLEERMLYSLFCADESRHLSQIRGFLMDEPEKTQDPFFQLLAELAESGDRSVLLFVIQVVLEGWGLSHYRRLAKHCAVPELASLLLGFLQEESRHHATGVTLFQEMTVSPVAMDAVTEILTRFLQMVQVGPQAVVAAIAQTLGHLSMSQKVTVFEQLDTQVHSAGRLAVLQNLMQTGGGGAIIARLHEKGAFEPLPATICAAI
ncbi:ferritin-like domain-containing protein [filamentous cyanobacterium LEGE 11480]|uniref:Ferritin-like domain-containing protein n=1 Tax=Romeriopsis navalis LEGE 11480 TaxID=2777977 RepID=A0A928VJB9_9CYAN|nr:ferritin-like domain-containing protein [Romeriopsis navalis]MBE9029683.1 ferritin-like domain-containing protein [Romeriopsis navalis LEGE 11480]